MTAKTPAEIADTAIVGEPWLDFEDEAEGVRSTIIDAIEADRAQSENDGTLHAAVIAALRDRIELDRDEAEGYTYRARAVEWIEAEPDEFWMEFAGPLLDDIEARFRE